MQVREIKAALSSAWIEPRYQPIVRLGDGLPVAVEALARLNHPSLGLLGAGRFVPQIELAGLAGELTEQIAATTFTDIAAVDPGPAGLVVGINIPLDLLLLPSTLARLEARREAAGLEPTRVVVELTESQPVEDIDRLARVLEQLRRTGYGAVIDDVVPAMAYLPKLLDLPFTGLKLDGGLVRMTGQSATALRFAAAIVAAAHRYGLTVTAEGIEDSADWARMLDLGADQAQGFLVAEAMEAASLPAWRLLWAASSRAETAAAAGTAVLTN